MKRRWFQFRLRTLMGVLTLAAVATGLTVRHVRFVQQRIRYHQARLANCEERIMMRQDPSWLSSRWPSVWSEFDQRLPAGHLLYNPPTSERKYLWAILQQVNREIAHLDESKTYHQRQILQYREALWRPWIRVPREEIFDLPPELAPEVPGLVAEQPSASAIPPQQRADAESKGLTPWPKVRSRWQPIERPLPQDFDRRDVHMERVAGA